MKRLTNILILLALFTSLTMSGAQKQTSGGDEQMNAFINNLMGKMTLDEKLGQLNLPA